MSLQKLLEIRTKRKERIFIDLRVASENIVSREKIQKEKEEGLSNYRVQRVVTQKALFDDIASQGFTIDDHNKYLAELEKIDDQEKQYVEHLQMANTLLQTAKSEYQQTKAKSLAIMREFEKLAEILKGSEKAEKIMALRKEETESEDYVAR